MIQIEITKSASRRSESRAAGADYDWPAAGLARVDGRRGDASALRAAVTGWERLGARFERA